MIRARWEHEIHYDPSSDEIWAIRRVPAGYGKVAVVEELETGFPLPTEAEGERGM